MRLFYPFTRDRHRKVIGPCWYGQDTCSEQFLRVSDLNEARSEAKRGPKKVVFKTPGKHFSIYLSSLQSSKTQYSTMPGNFGSPFAL